MTTYQIKISGMGCEHCVSSVKSALSSIGAQVEHVESGFARVSFSGGVKEIEAAIDDAGFDVISIEAQ